MSDPIFRLVDGALVELGEAEIAERAADYAIALASAKGAALARVKDEANARVASTIPDIEAAQAIRAHQASLEATIQSKQKLHTLAAVDITAGWPN